MPFSLLPKVVTHAVTDLTPSYFHGKNIRLLMLDFDNTIVPYTTNIPTAKMQVWLETMMESDISVCVVSNSKNDRVKKFCDQYGVHPGTVCAQNIGKYLVSSQCTFLG